MGDVIAVFPLNHVLLPGMPLPLHIFEERYLRLLTDVTRQPGQACFGVVALRHGAETVQLGAPPIPPDIADVGTLAEILEIEHQQDGASDLLTIGSRRFRIRTFLHDPAPYLRAEVEWLDERDGALRPAQIVVTRRLCSDFSELLSALTGREVGEPLPRDANMLSYYVASHMPLEPQDRQALLAQPTAADRLHLAIALLRREIRLLQSTRSIAMAPSVLRLIAVAN